LLYEFRELADLLLEVTVGEPKVAHQIFPNGRNADPWQLLVDYL